jgi:hypothetical protein
MRKKYVGEVNRASHPERMILAHRRPISLCNFSTEFWLIGKSLFRVPVAIQHGQSKPVYCGDVQAVGPKARAPRRLGA